MSQQDDEDDDAADLYPQRPPTSAIRYTGEVLPRSRKTRVVHQPAKETVRFRGGPRIHWLFWTGLALLVMVAGFLALSALGSWWQVQQDDWHYGRPRTAQYDAVVGHNGDGDGKPDLNIHIGDQVIVFLNNGKQFVAPQQH